LNLCDS